MMFAGCAGAQTRSKVLAQLDTSIEMLRSDGKFVHPLADEGQVASVFIFVLPDCPISNSYALEMRHLR